MGKMANFMFYLFCHNLKRTKEDFYMYSLPSLPPFYQTNSHFSILCFFKLIL